MAVQEQSQPVGDPIKHYLRGEQQKCRGTRREARFR